MTYNPPAAAAPFAAAIEKAAAAHNVDRGVLYEVAAQESAFNPDAVSPVGAKGLFQFMDATAREWNVNQFDPDSSADGAARYLRWLLDREAVGGDYVAALSSYNWGIGNWQRKGAERAPAETRHYARKIIAKSGIADRNPAAVNAATLQILNR